MKNTLTDLNNHLFEQLERLNDDELDEAQLEKELRRAEGMTKVATQIIQNAELAYKTMCTWPSTATTARKPGRCCRRCWR